MSDDVAVRFGLDDGAFQKGLSGMTESIGGFKGALTAAAAAAAAVLGVLKLASLASDAIKVGDELQRMSEVTGITVSSLSNLRAASEVSDTSLQQVAGAVKFLQRNLVAAQKDGSETADIFKALGIDAKAAMNMDPGDLLKDVGKKLAGVEDASLRTAAGVKIFGRSATELTPFFNAIDQGDEITKKFGLTLSDKFGANADEFNDNLATMKMLLTNVGASLAEKVLPALIALVKWVLDASLEFKKFSVILDVFAGAFKLVATIFIAVGAVVKVVIDQVWRLAEMLTRFLVLDFRGVVTAFGNAGKDLSGVVSETATTINGIWAKSGDDTANSTKDATEKQKKDYSALSEAVSGEAKARAAAEKKAAEEAHKLQEKTLSEAMKLNREYTDFYLETGKIQLVDKRRILNNELAAVEGNAEEELKIRKELASVEKELQAQIQIGVIATADVWRREYKGIFAELKAGFNESLGSLKWWEGQFADSMDNIRNFAKDAFSTFANGFGRAVADTLVEGKSLAQGLKNTFKDIAKSFIAEVTTMMVKWAALQAMQSLGLAPAAGAASSAVAGGANVATGVLASMGPAGWGAVALIGLAALGKDGIAQIATMIKDFLKQIPEVIKELVAQIPALIDAIIDAIPAIVDAIVKALPELTKSLARAMPAITQALIREAPTIVMAFVKAMPEIFAAMVKSMVMNQVVIVRETAKMLANMVKEVWKSVAEFFKEIWKGIKDAVVFIFAPVALVVAAVKGMVDGIQSVIDIIGNVIQAIKDLVDKIFGWIGDVTGGLGKGVSGALGGGLITNPLGGIGDAISSVGHLLGFASGGSFMTTKPQMFLAGERGPERITVSPAGTAASAPGNSSGGGSYTFNGPVFMDEITMRNFARMQNRMTALEAQRYAR